MAIFKYHPDNLIFRNNAFYKSFADFNVENPNFPIIEGEFFEYKESGEFELIINFNGTFTGIKRNPLGFQGLIDAINNLGE